MTKWSEWEVDVISVLASFNDLVSKEDALTPKYISSIWSISYPNFPSRSPDSIRHKMSSVAHTDIDSRFMEYLKSTPRSIVSINDIAILFNVPADIAEKIVKAIEFKHHISFYDQKTSCFSVRAVLDLVEGNTESTPVKVIHAKEFFEEQMNILDKTTTEPKIIEVIDPVPKTKKEKKEKAESEDILFNRLNELRYELNNPETSKNRKKSIKKSIKRIKKKLGVSDEYISLYDKEHDENEQDNTPTTENIPDQSKLKDWIEEAIPETTLDKEPVSTSNTEIVHFKLGIISDTHIGSKWFDADALKGFYKKCRDECVTRIIHAGDLFDGSTTYSYQEKDQNLVGYREQFNWIVKNYPKYEGISTYIVAGNHDVNIMKKHNIHPIIELAKVRFDIKYSGDYYTDFNKHGVIIRVVHCDGSNYSGEPMTKLKGLIDTTYNKCHIFIMGHLHQAMELHDYGDVQYAVAPGCFVKPNEYTIRRAYVPAVGGFILDVTYDPSTDKVKVDSRWLSNDQL